MRIPALVLALLTPATAAAQHYQTDFPAEEFKARHATVFEQIGAGAVAQGVSQTEGFTLPRQHNTLNFTDFLPMELDEMERLVLEKGVVQKVPPTPASAVPTGR